VRTPFLARSSAKIYFEIVSLTDRSLPAEGYITAAPMDRQSFRSRPLPPAKRNFFRRIQDEEFKTAQGFCGFIEPLE
jgi:acyl-CoA thioesterase FadM